MTAEEALAERLRNVSGKILSASRDELYFQMRYLGLALSSFSFVVTTDLPGIGTDGQALAVHPKVLADVWRRDRRMVNRLYLHEVYHCLFRHIFKPVKPQKLYWMLACDMAVEFLIDDGDFRATRMAHSRLRDRTRSSLLRTCRVLNAENIYRELCRTNPSLQELSALQAEFCLDCHDLWPSLTEDPNRSRNRAQQRQDLENRWREISEKTRTRMESFSTEQSSGSRDFLEQTRVENRERYSYRSFLRKFASLHEEMRLDPDTFDYVLYTFGLSMYGNMPLIEPTEYREVQRIDEFVIVIDVSMSVSGPLVQTFLRETYSVLSESESYLKKVHIRIIQCDERVRSDRKITCRGDLDEYMDHFTLTGHGGTDFRPAFSYVEELVRKKEFRNLRGLLYFTDGKGIYPKKKPPFLTAFIFCEEDYEDRNVPPWAIRLVLPREETDVKRDERKESHFIWEEDQL